MEDQSISVKELLIRVEATLKDEIGSLRKDVERFQDNVVTRAEHKTTTDHIYKELARIEHRVDSVADDWKKALDSFKDDLRDDQRRLMGYLTIAFVAVEFALRWFVN